jgi:hypothetical protein
MMPPVRRLFGVVVGVGLVAAGLACGPSFTVIYEGNARFEHCYALEENPQALVPEKADCWRNWSERYTYGQTRDRIHYATARYVALSQATNVPTDEAMMMAAPGMTPRQSTITAPSPTNAFAPPPKVLENYPDAASRALPRAPGAANAMIPTLDAGSTGAAVPAGEPLPSAGCTEGCARTFRDCGATCAPDAGATCAACVKSYKTCMRACFK